MFNSNLTMVYKVMFRILKIMCRTVMMACICFYWGWRCAYHVTTYFAVLILSCKRRRVDNLAHIYLFNWLVDWTRSLRNAVFALCLLKCVFIKMVLWFADLESSKLCPFCFFVSWVFGLGFLGVTQHSIVIPLCPILRCHPLLLSASLAEGI